MKSDEQLMVDYQSGDEVAFQELFRRYSPRVYGYLNKRIPDREKANDVFQMVFMKIHRSRHLYESGYRFTPWLFTICRSVLIDSARTGKIYESNKTEAYNEMAAPEPEQLNSVPLDSLNEEDKHIVQMRYFEEMEFDQIAEKLGVTSQTVRKRVSRAIGRLRKVLLQE